MNRPRIGVDFHTWDSIYQGVRSYVLGLFGEAVSLAPDIDFYFFANRVDSLRNEWNIGNVGNAFFIRMPVRSGAFRLLVQLPVQTYRCKLDLLHMQFGIPPMHRNRCLTTIHDVLFESHPTFFNRHLATQLRASCRYAAKHARSVFTISEFSRRELEERFHLDPRKIVVTPCGVDTQRFSPLTTAQDQEILTRFGLETRKFILTVGRLEPRKNHITLIKAIVAANIRETPLVIVGQRYYFRYDNVQREILQARAQGFTIHLLENVDGVALPVLMRHCSVFAFLTFAEGFGMPPLEAMACGAIVLASNTTAIPEVVGEAGLLVDPTDVSGVAVALKQLLTDAALRCHLAQNATTQVKRFSWCTSAKALVNEYRRLLGGHHT